MASGAGSARASNPRKRAALAGEARDAEVDDARDGDEDSTGAPSSLGKDDLLAIFNREREQMAADIKTDLARMVDDRMAASGRSVVDQISQLIESQNQANQAQFRQVQTDLKRVTERAEATAHDQQAMRDRLQSIETLLAAAEAAPPPAPAYDDSFERAVDPTILVASLEADTTKEVFLEAIKGWLDEASVKIPDEAEVLGEGTMRRFIIKFKGVDNATAARRMRKARQLLRTSTGWRPFPTYKSAVGSTHSKIFFDSDKNPAQVRRERDSKRLHKLITEVLPEGKRRLLHLNRTDGLLAMAGKPLLRVVPQQGMGVLCSVGWNRVVAEEHGIITAPIMESFRAFSRAISVAEVNWSDG